MATLTASGIGSGLDIDNIVSSLVAADRQTKELSLIRRESTIQAEISAYGTLKSNLSPIEGSVDTLLDDSTYKNISVSSSAPAEFTATVDEDNPPSVGNYNVEVTQLATYHRIKTADFADDTVSVGTGTLSFDLDGESFSITVDNDNNDLYGISNAINESESNSIIDAVVMKADSGYSLVLTSKKTGSSNQIVVTAVDDDSNDTDQSGLSQLISTHGDELTVAKDSIIKFNSQTVTSENTIFKDVIKGLTIDVKSVSEEGPSDLTVKKSHTRLITAFDDMVDKVNEFIKSSNQLTAYNQETGVAATLQGDSLARNLKSGLNRVLGQQDDTISGSYNSLISIGLSVDQNGIYSFDSGKLTEALDSEDNYDSIISMINGDDGFAKNIKTYVDSFVSGDGVLTSKSDSLQQSLKEVDASRESLELRLEKLEKRYRDQFGAMDALVATLQAESNFLLQGLANLPGFTRDKD